MPFKKGIYIFTLIGLFMGFTLDALLRQHNTTVFYYALISLSCFLYALAYNETHVVRLLASSVLVALFLSLPLLSIKLDAITIYMERLFTFLLLFPFFTYAGHSFHYAGHHDNSLKIKYPTLFEAVWNTIPLLFVASLFAGLANLLIVLAAFIFKTVGTTYLWTLYFENPHFRLISNITLFFIGLSVGQQNTHIINSLRFLLLRMMYYLFPFLALISIVYFFLYLGHSVSQQEEYVNPLTVLIPLVSMGIVFFNAYFQDGNTEINIPHWLKITFKIYRVTLFLLTLMMVYRIVHENTLNGNSIIVLATITLYSFIYAVTAWYSENTEKLWIQRGNIATALFFIITLFLCNLPFIK